VTGGSAVGQEGRRFRGDAAARRGDRSYWVIQACQLAGLALGLVAASRVHAADFGGPPELWPALGCAVGLAGLALRAWAISSLGPLFTRHVRVDAGHHVVETGPYRWVRHPAYTGAILLMAGVGLGLGNALALAFFLVLPTAGYLWRIPREEALLRGRLGGEYARYAARTRRLVPGVW
jgi:protein-S-isoprenylcysteine O-methyltransferase Ste14